MTYPRFPSPLYPPGSVRMLVESDLVTPATRQVLRARLAAPMVETPRFFDQAGFATACAVTDRLIPQPERPRPIDLCGLLDTHLAEELGDGWRYATMPPDPDMHRAGMVGIEQAATVLFGGAFVQLPDAKQDRVLLAVQRGTSPGTVWLDMDPRRYFEELLALAVELYYAHPLASEEIGYAGMADAHGWQVVGLGEREAHEPVATTLEAAA